MQRIERTQHAVCYTSAGPEPDSDTVQLVWAHGWMQNHASLAGLAASFTRAYNNVLFDLPGFGQSTLPSTDWGTEEYAEDMAAILADMPCVRRIWIGHSFGCRVGIRLACRHPRLVDGLFLIAAPGIPVPRPLGQRIRFRAKVTTYKILKKLLVNEAWREKLRQRFSSQDFKNAGAMRPVFSKVVRENLSDCAEQITCPVHLVYGEQDTETSPRIGERYRQLIPGSELTLLPHFGHLDILSEGKHQVANLLQRFLSAD